MIDLRRAILLATVFVEDSTLHYACDAPLIRFGILSFPDFQDQRQSC